MKVKDITLSEAEITIKPLPGAQQLSVDGKPIGQANDPAVAQQIAQATKDGKLTLNDPTKPQMGSQGAGIQEEPANPSTAYKVDTSTGKPMAMSSPKPTAIVGSQRWQAITPEIEAKASSQGFRTVYLNVNGQMIKGLEGGDMKLGSKIIIAPADYQKVSGSSMSTTPARVDPGQPAPARIPKVDPGQPAPARMPTRESADDQILQQMLSIAGLR